MRRNQLVVGLQIGSGKPDLTAARPSRDDRAVDEVRVSEQGAGFVDAPLGDQPPDACAAHDKILVAYRVDLVSPETVVLAERAQHREVPAAAVAEEKVRSNPHLRDPQPVHQHRPDERFRVPFRQLAREPHDCHAADARAMKRLEPLRFGHEQLRCLVRPQDARRMRIEGHRHRRAAMLGSTTPDALDDLEVTAMQAVEIAERQNRMHQPRRPGVVREVDGLHSLHVDSHVEHEPIICQFNARRQARAGGGVPEVVRHVRHVRAPRLQPGDDVERFADTLKCVTCGRSRSASMTSVSTPATSSMDESSIRLQSVRYAKSPKRNPSTGIGPCHTGTGMTRTPFTVNGPRISCGSSFGMPPPTLGTPSKM